MARWFSKGQAGAGSGWAHCVIQGRGAAGGGKPAGKSANGTAGQGGAERSRGEMWAPPSPGSRRASHPESPAWENTLLFGLERQSYPGILASRFAEWQHLFFSTPIHSCCWVNHRGCGDHWPYFIVWVLRESIQWLYLWGFNYILILSLPLLQPFLSSVPNPYWPLVFLPSFFITYMTLFS